MHLRPLLRLRLRPRCQAPLREDAIFRLRSHGRPAIAAIRRNSGVSRECETTFERCLKLGTTCRFDPRVPRASRASPKTQHTPNSTQDNLLQAPEPSFTQTTGTRFCETNTIMNESKWLSPQVLRQASLKDEVSLSIHGIF